ncbi:hypothetical protein D3C81_2226370 [compost metagenome]
MIPRAVAEFAERFGVLVQLPVSLRALVEPVGAVSRAGTELSPSARLLLEELLSEC